MTARRAGLATLTLMLVAAGTAYAAFEPEASSPYPTGSEPYAVYAADFNADGRPDIAVLNGSSSNVNLYLRQPGGGFAEEAGSPFPAGFGPSFAAIADFNADARPDIAVANYSGNSVTLMLRQPGGGFTSQTQGVGFSASAIGAGHFDGDGQTDLAVADWFNNQVRIYTRDGGGGFVGGTPYATGVNPRQIEVADFNGDSLADIAIANAGSDSVTVLLRSGSGFAAEGAFAVGDAPAGLVAADFNADGRTDLAVANNAGTVSLLLRNANNTGFTEEPGSPLTVGGTPTGIASADFNGDGRPDLAVAANTSVVVLLRNASGGFTADTPLSTSGAPYGIAAADFDGDARPDLAVSALATNTLWVFRNPAPPQPPPVPTPTPTPTPTATPVAPPVAGRSVNATPVTGKVKVKLPGAKRFVDLSQAANLPVGTTVDARNGRVTLLAAGQGGQADFFAGIFRIGQSRGSRPLTTLTLTEQLSCPQRGKASAAAKRKKSRRLWGDGRGAFRTSGKYAAATVRGTKWLVTDRCDRTTAKVTRGSVSVRDKVARRTVILRAGRSYTARARRR